MNEYKMYKKRSDQRKKKDNLVIKGVRTPSDIEKMMAQLNRDNANPRLKKFIIYTCERQVYGHDDSNEYIIYCLSSYFILGTKRYHLLPPLTNFVPIDQIQAKAHKDFKIAAGIQETLLELIKIKTENLSAQNKVVMLSMDETTLNPGLEYDEDLNLMIGYEDNGKVRTQAQARIVTNIWVSCLGGTWIMPLVYIFTEKSASSEQIKELIFESISKLNSIGLNVIGIVTKMHANFQDLSLQLNISPTNQTFKVGTTDTIFLFDVPQLMNITRNILMKYRLKFDNFQTSWTFVKMLYVLDCQNSNQKTKLTMNHLKPSKTDKVFPRFATELMSNTVATEMRTYISNKKLPEAAEGTARFFELMNKLFDMLNSSEEIGTNQFNSAYKGTKNQVEFLEEIINFFRNLKVFLKDKDCTEELQFVKAWLISIKGIMKIWDVVKTKNYSYLLTRNTNCEAVDKFMSFTRLPALMGSGNRRPYDFLNWYKQLFLSSYFDSDMPDVNQTKDLEGFLEKVFKRLPPTIHNVEMEEKDATSLPQNSSHLACPVLNFQQSLDALFEVSQQ